MMARPIPGAMSVLVMVACACGPSAAPPSTTPSGQDETTVETATAASLPRPATQPGPLTIEPEEAGDGRLPDAPTAFVAEHGTMMDHATRFGWSRDGAVFAMCSPSGGLACTNCQFVGVDGRTEALSGLDPGVSSDEEEAGCTAAGRDEIARRWQALGIGGGSSSWAYGGALKIIWHAHQTEERSTLVVGAQAREGGPEGHAVTIVEPMRSLHPELLLPSPDGSRLAVVSHAFAGEYSDTFHVELVPMGKIAASAYRAIGVQALADGRASEAVDPLLRATAADPRDWTAPLVLAQAWIAVDDPRAELALREALVRDEIRARNRAKQDPGFAAVHDEAWFRELVGGHAHSH